MGKRFILFSALGLFVAAGIFAGSAWHLKQTAGPVHIDKTLKASSPNRHVIDVPIGSSTKALENGIVPVRFEIPSLHVDAKVQHVGMKGGQMGVPSNFTDVAWDAQGTKPGALGNAVIDGHVDSKYGPGVFMHLKDIQPGAKVIVLDSKGDKITFEVTEVKSYPRNNAPLSVIFGNFDQRNLNLITCTGLFDTQAGTHEERLVVYTQRVSASPS